MNRDERLISFKEDAEYMARSTGMTLLDAAVLVYGIYFLMGMDLRKLV